MKKLLALVLTLVMTMALVVTSNAAFTDAADIEHTEAVEVLNALNVINGKEDGSFFDPNGTVTRAEMAKMITVIMLGDVDVTAFKGTTTDLKDATGWAEAYIKFCYSQGIIAGKGNNLFDGNANVTAAEAAKMLLVAIGYNAEVQGYTGAQWAINVTRDAQMSKFYDDLSVGAYQALTRDEAAQMIYNAVLAKTIVKSSSVDRLTGNITDIYEATGDSLLEETFGATRTVMTFNGDEKINASLKEGQIKVDNTTITYTMDNGNDWIGEKVEVLWKDNATKGTKNTLDKEDAIYGVYNNGETEVLNVTKNDIGDQKSTDVKIKVSGTKYDTENTVTVWTNYTSSADKDATNGTTSANSDLTTALKQSQSGDKIKLILDDGKVKTAYITEYKLGTVTAVNSEKVTISGLGAIKIADNDVYSGIAKNDVVVYTKLYDATTADAYVTVTEAESVSGKVDGYKGTENVTLDGTVYKTLNKTTFATTNVGGETGEAQFTTGMIGENFTLYLVNGYVAAAVQTSESATNYSLIIDTNAGAGVSAGNNWNPLKVVALGADGVKTTLTVDKDGATSFNIGDIITWTGTASEANIKVEKAFSTAAADGYVKVAANGTIYDKTAKTLNGTVTATDCVLFVKTSGNTAASNVDADATYKAYNIRDLKDVKAGANDVHVIYVVKNSKVVAAFANLAAAPSGATSSVVYGIVSASNGVFEIDDVEYNRYTVVSNDESYTINIKKSSDTGTVAKGKVIAFAPTNDDQYSNSDIAVLSSSSLSSVTVDGSNYTADVVAVKNYDEAEQLLTYFTGMSAADPDGIYTGTGEITKAVADDVEIIYVNCDGDKAGDEIGVSAFDAMTGKMNAIIVFNGDGVINRIIVETSGEKNIYE